MKAIRFHQTGGPEVLQYEDVPDPHPGAGEVLIRVAAVGVNYSEVRARASGERARLPMVLGNEGGGMIVGIGSGVDEVAVGDLVACQGWPGCYAELVTVPADRVVKLPEGMSPETAAAFLFQGLTAHAMAFGAYQVREGDRVLVHAGAGGVGVLLTQMAKHAGAAVFATVGSDAKIEVAREARADHVINYTTHDFAEEILQATGGAGVNAIFDSVGRATFLKGFTCLAPRGVMVAFGQASGPASPFDLALLSRTGGYVTRTSTSIYTASRSEWLTRANDVLAWAHSEKLRTRITTYPLADAARAHRDLEGRKSVGKLLLIP